MNPAKEGRCGNSNLQKVLFASQGKLNIVHLARINVWYGRNMCYFCCFSPELFARLDVYYYLCTHINSTSTYFMEHIIGRTSEIQQLESLATSGRAEFVALYGRRRVGKTFLINSVFEEQFAFRMTGVIDGTLEDQFTAFEDAMDDYGYEMPENPKNWMAAFVMLKNALSKVADKNEKCVIFIDELPALDEGGSNIANAVGYFWNSWASLHDNITLIICGSATSWMIDNVIDSHGGLHDRLTEEMHIHPFQLIEVEEYLDAHGFLWNRQMILQAYMVFGGIPYYLSLLNKKESVVQNIDRLFFSQDVKMRREYKRLMKTLYKNPMRYIEIIKALSKTRAGMTREQIAKELGGANNGHLGEKLENLCYCDLVRKNVVREKQIKKNGAIYQLSDFFCLFYLTFIDRAETERNYWSHHINTSEVNSWMGLAYERVCIAHVEEIKRSLRIDAISTLCYSWRSKESTPAAQIDIVIERADRIVNICEVKYSNDEYNLDKEEYTKLSRRLSTFVNETGLRHAPWLTMITTEGLAPGKYTGMIQSVIMLDDLFVRSL